MAGRNPKINLSDLFNCSKDFPSNITNADKGKIVQIVNDILLPPTALKIKDRFKIVTSCLA